MVSSEVPTRRHMSPDEELERAMTDYLRISRGAHLYASGDEHEKVQKVPKDLDMTPYLAPPVNRRLVEAMKKAMGGAAKEPKALAHYTAQGRPAEHCGKVVGWPCAV